MTSCIKCIRNYLVFDEIVDYTSDIILNVLSFNTIICNNFHLVIQACLACLKYIFGGQNVPEFNEKKKINKAIIRQTSTNQFLLENSIDK